MAVPRESSVGRSRGGFRGTWFWLAASFAATVFWTAEEPRRLLIVDMLGEHWILTAVLFVGWFIGWAILGSILASLAPDRSVRSVYLLSGRTVVSVAAGVLLARAMCQGPWTLVEPKALAVGLGAFGFVGLGWWLLVDVPRVLLWRLSQRPAPPLLSVANLAALGGLLAVAVVLQRDLAGDLGDDPFRVGLMALIMIGSAAAVLTVVLELPRAIILRAAARAETDGHERVAVTLGRLAGRTVRSLGEARRDVLRSRPEHDPQGPSGGIVRARSRSAIDHARIAPPPTVVRRP